MDTFERSARDKLSAYFKAFAEGGDVPPAKRYFLEGYLQAAVDLQRINREQVLELIAELCERHFDAETARVYRQADAPLVLHSHMKRAPVYPTG